MLLDTVFMYNTCIGSSTNFRNKTHVKFYVAHLHAESPSNPYPILDPYPRNLIFLKCESKQYLSSTLHPSLVNKIVNYTFLNILQKHEAFLVSSFLDLLWHDRMLGEGAIFFFYNLFIGLSCFPYPVPEFCIVFSSFYFYCLS